MPLCMAAYQEGLKAALTAGAEVSCTGEGTLWLWGWDGLRKGRFNADTAIAYSDSPAHLRQLPLR